MIKSITPVFSTSYAGLKKLALLATVDISQDVQNLISITDYQSELHTISITITSETWKAFHLRFSITPLQPWFQACFRRPLLQHIILSLDALSPEFFFDILAMFFQHHVHTSRHLHLLKLSLKALRTIVAQESRSNRRKSLSFVKHPHHRCHSYLQIMRHTSRIAHLHWDLDSMTQLPSSKLLNLLGVSSPFLPSSLIHLLHFQ